LVAAAWHDGQHEDPTTDKPSFRVSVATQSRAALMTTDPPLPYRLRTDLEWTPIQGRRRHWWVAKDPLRSSLFRCGDEVRLLLQSLDGRRSILELQQSLSQGEANRSISRRSILNIIRSAIQKQLLIPSIGASNTAGSIGGSNAAGQKNSLAAWLRFVQQSPWMMIQGKRRLGNAESLLKKLAIRSDWLLSGSAVRFWLAIVLTSMLLVLAKATTQSLSILPGLSEVADHAVYWLVILLLTRVAHELGHAIACVRMGARCREYGIFFMLGIACPYVDVTDSWRLANRKDRMAIAAAGIFVEWIIAAIAGFIWYFSQPCWLHSVAWQVMVVCSLTTLLINANPLMRYDGYFLLSDYLEVVNLREESDAVCSRLSQRWWLGEASTIDDRPWTWRDCGLLAYACMSWLYRCSLIVALVGSVHAICTRWQLPKLGWAFAILMFASFLLIPMSQKMFQSWSEARRSPKGPVRLVVMWLGCAALILNIGWLPLPHRIACQGSVQPESRTLVYTQTAGRVPLTRPHDHHEPYPGVHDSHSPESLLLALENPWIEDRARQAIYRQKRLECQIAATRMAAYRDPATIDRLPALSTMASIALKQTSNALNDVQSLQIKRPKATWVPLELPPLESLDGSRPNRPSHTVADPACLGQWLPAGTPIGYFTESERVSIAATIPISQLGDISVGMTARIRFEQLPSQIYEAKVIEISGLTATPDTALGNHSGNRRLANGESSDPSSFVSILLSVDGASQQKLGMGGTAEVVVWSKPKSLYHHVAHLAGATFGPSGLQTLSR
jgi:putative peptide zinc metalloprotease protein